MKLSEFNEKSKLTADPGWWLRTEQQKDLYEVYLKMCEELVGEEQMWAIDKIARQTLKHLANPKDKRTASAEMQELEKLWYESLDNGEPNYNIYGSEFYLGELWACWKFYSRSSLLEILKPKSLAPLSVYEDIGPVRSVVDLGCGIGLTSAALTKMFPLANVTATNIGDTPQAAIAQRLANEVGFLLVEEAAGETDLVFASEYFEHFEAPVDHLRWVIRNLNPQALLIANAFGTRAIGHFDIYSVDNQLVRGKEASRLFNTELRKLGYEKVKTKVWNQRPAYWRKKRD